jgi:hypothetical protein
LKPIQWIINIHTAIDRRERKKEIKREKGQREARRECERERVN